MPNVLFYCGFCCGLLLVSCLTIISVLVKMGVGKHMGQGAMLSISSLP